MPVRALLNSRRLDMFQLDSAFVLAYLPKSPFYLLKPCYFDRKTYPAYRVFAPFASHNAGMPRAVSPDLDTGPPAPKGALWKRTYYLAGLLSDEP